MRQFRYKLIDGKIHKLVNPKKKAGRKKIEIISMKELPPKQIILEQVLYWINLQATAEEIAGSFYVSVDTLVRRLEEEYGLNFAELYKKANGGGKLSLRKYQFDQAKKNATMAIWLGKQWLGQKDHEEKMDAPKQEDIELKNRLYASLYQVELLTKELNDLKSKTSQELQRSDPQVQSMDRSSEFGEDVRIT